MAQPPFAMLEQYTPPDSRANLSLDNRQLISLGCITGAPASPAGYYGHRTKEVQQKMYIVPVLLCCCSPLVCVILTPMTFSENLTRRVPGLRKKLTGSRVDYRLPFYTSGFE